MDIDLSASALERVDACVASAVLPQVLDSSEDAERGTIIHAYAHQILSGVPHPEALALVPVEYRDTCANIDWQRAIGDLHDVRSEVAYAWDVGTGTCRELGINVARNYGALRLGPDELPGTEDFEGERFDHVIVTGDWKTGFEEVTRCADNPQPTFFARIRSALHRAERVEGRIVYIRESGRVRTDSHTFTAFELDSFEDHVTSLVSRVRAAQEAHARGERLVVSAGDHCRYCPAMSVCPAYTALAKSMLPDLEEIDRRLEALSPADRGIAWSKMKAVETLLEKVKDGLKELAKREPFPLPNGKEVRPVTFPVSRFSSQRALTLLRSMGATQEQIDGCEVPTQQTQIRELKARKWA